MSINLAGAWTALVTPLKSDGSVDYDGWRQLIRLQIEAGIDGLVPLGTTGETPTLEDGEEEKLIKLAVAEAEAATKGAARGKIPLLVGAGSNSTKSMLFYVRRAKDLGADGVLITTPYYNKPNDSGLLAHFEAAAGEGIPVVVYNIPGRTGRNIPAALMKELMGIPAITGVKEASGDIVQIGEIIGIAQKHRPDFQVISGDDGLTLPAMALGGTGVISVISNLVPQKVAALTRALAADNIAEGRRLHFELLPLVRAAFIETNPVPVKTAMNLMGLPSGPVRPPLGPLSGASTQLVKDTLRQLGLLPS